MTAPHDFGLSRNALGRLVFTAADGAVHECVLPVRAFPVTAPETGVALISIDGRELAWIDHPSELRDDIRQLLFEELASREFMPEIRQIRRVSSYATPSTWAVTTDRGDADFVLRGEEDIRHLGGTTLLIADKFGIQFLIRDRNALDHHSRRILDRFL
jgi:hypothetical protein